MKKNIKGVVLIAITLLVTLYALTGCGNNKDDENTSKSNGSSEEVSSIEQADKNVPSTIYARFYGDGTLILSSTDYVDEDRKRQDSENYVDFGEISNEGGQSWSKYSSKIIKAIIYNKIKPTTTRSWFSKCTNLEVIENMNYLITSNVTNMDAMFYGCESLTSIDVSNFDTSNVIEMNYMFSGCKSLTSIDVSKFDTSNVTNMESMFSGCKSLTSINVSKFDTSNVINMKSMFYGCESLKTIYASEKFKTDKVFYSSNMFAGCNNLKGGNGTAYSSSNKDATYARIDKTDQPGYFTEK